MSIRIPALRVASLLVPLISLPAALVAQSADRVRWTPPALELPGFLSDGRPSSAAAVTRLGLKPVPPLVPFTRTVPDVVLRGPVPSASQWLLGTGALRLRRRLDARREGLFRPVAPSPALDRLARLARAVASGTEELEELPFGADLSELDVEITGQAELAGDWTGFRPCDPQVQFSCESGYIPQLNPDLQFGVRIQGNVTDRIRLDVDFDQAREFSAANNINVFYEGKEDEVLQRLELGDVTFELPASRFLTRGIPAGNFGFQAQGQAGPLAFRGVWAQQRGDLSTREFRLSGGGGQESFVQADTLVLDDADYVLGQFFFLVDPEELRDFPHVDVLDLDPTAAPPSRAPGIEPVQVYRLETDLTTRQQVQGLIQADARASKEGEEVVESGWFRYLQPGVDYTVHSSGLWIALRRPLQGEEALAVTFVTASGDTVGTYNPERISNAGGRPDLRLLKATSANHRPGRPTWDLEMHQVYRVSSSPDVDPASVDLTISLGERSAGRTFTRGLTGDDITWLRLFGLDEESPVDELDRAGVYKPAQEFLQDQPPVPGVFLIFPTLRPFQAPPPLDVLGLDAEEASQLLGSDANPRIYEAEDPFDRENGGLFRLTIPFELRSQGVISSFSLGAFAIRDGSERIFLSDRLLQRDIDYRIDYDIGQVTLIQPEVLFATATDPVVRASWEQKSLFRVAPTTVFGLTGHIDVGDAGGFDLVALHQREQAIVRRPQLGVEPGAITLGGMNMNLDFPAHALDRLTERISGLRLGGPSRLGVEGELAFSLPNPNVRRDVFVDDFDTANERALSLISFDWSRGSVPQFRDGAENALPQGLNEVDQGSLVWQHTWVQEGVQGDSLGVFEGFLPQADIDRQINVTGSLSRETGLLLSFDPVTGFDGPSWRSITTSLSQTGLDISKSEFLEFYAADGESLTLVLDLGSVGEDALFVDPEGRVVGTKSTGAPWGLGVLDHEADPRRGEIWSDELDRLGVWNEPCEAQRAAVYRIGDSRANCTRGNGRQDSEDLDGDGNLDTLERYRRFVVRLDGSSPYLTRTRSETGTQFRLYRIPIRDPNSLGVPRAFTEADFRSVRHLRITVVGEESDRLTLSRMRIIGSRWVKRAGEGVLDGLVGEEPGFGGRGEVGPVSSVTEGAVYQAPPGVLEELDDPTAAFGGQGLEFNEKGLKVQYSDIEPGNRLEVFNRFPQRPRDFLTYRQMRLWVVARDGDWGPEEPLFFFVKVGEDAENFYLYRTPLRPAANSSAIQPEDWLPEVLIDFEEWIDLRRRAEEALIFTPPSPTDPPLELWSADSTYAVVLKDRARAPNLGAVREVSLGVLNGGEFATSGEVWVNELRLSDAFEDVGLAGRFGVELDASDVWSTRATVSTRGSVFRQLEESPTYQSDRVINVNSTLKLDRFAPAEWGVEIPVVFSHTATDQDPSFLFQSDVRAADIEGLRKPGARRTRVDVAFSKRTPTANRIMGLLLDGLEARAGYFASSASTITSESDSEGFDARVTYGRELGRRDFAVFPSFLRSFVRFLLPGSLGDRVAESRFRWTPERVRLGGSYARLDQNAFRFDRIVRSDEDSLAIATRSPREALESAFELELRPFENLTATADLSSTRDLLSAEEAVADPRIQALIRDAQSRRGPIALGWETHRLLRTNVDFRPRFSDWLSGRLGFQTFYASDRDPAFAGAVVTEGDTALVLRRDLNGQRELTGSLTLLPARVFSVLAPADTVSFLSRAARSMATWIRPVNLSWQDGLTSRFNREAVDPGLAYQLGLVDASGFLVVDGDSATSFTDRTSVSLRSGFGLPGGLEFGVGYRRTDLGTLDTRSDRDRVDRTWPDLTARVTALTMPSRFPLLRQLSLSTGLSRRTEETTFGGRGLQRRFAESESLPIQLSLTWGGGIRTDYRGTLERGEGEDPTGITERERAVHEVSLASSFFPPNVFARHLDRPVTASLFFRYTADRNCRVTVGAETCTAFLDDIIRVLNLRLDTAVNRMDLRLQLSYTDRQSFVGLEAGSTQLQFGLFGNFTVGRGSFPR